MKNASYILLLILLSVSLVFGGAIIQFFSIESSSDSIILSWQSSNEQNVDYYEITRGPNGDNLSFVTKIDAKGSNSSYSYTDKNAYKTSDSFYAYGLVIVDKDGSKSDPIVKFITHNNISGVKRTWGSIKALFR